MTLDPRHAADRDLLAEAAALLLADREAAYPALVEAGKLTRDAAATGLRLARALAAQWAWIVDPACTPLPAWSPETGGEFGALHADVAADLARAADVARRRATRDPGERNCLIAERYAALRDLQADREPTGLPRIVRAIDSGRIMTRAHRAARTGASPC